MIRVRISLSMPKGCSAQVNWMAVAPEWDDLLGPYKRGEIDDAEYTRRYRRMLDANKGRILAQFDELRRRLAGRDAALMCWCGRGAFCHRRLLAAWLEENGRGRIDELDDEDGTRKHRMTIDVRSRRREPTLF